MWTAGAYSRYSKGYREIRQCCYDKITVLATSRATPATFGDRQVEIKSCLVPTLASFQQKSDLVTCLMCVT
jgi:hypothetical protein